MMRRSRNDNYKAAAEPDVLKDKARTSETLRRLLKYLRPFRTLLFFAFILAILGTAFDIVGPFIMGNTTNFVVNSIRSGEAFNWAEFMKFIYLLIALYVLGALGDFGRQRLGVSVNIGVVSNLREDISEKLKRLPVSYFDNNPVGDILSRMSNDVQSIADSLTQIINNFVKAVVTVFGIAIIMLYISPTLTLITILVIPLTILASFKIVQESQKQFKLQWEDLGNVNAHIEEMFSSNKLVKAYNYEDEAMDLFIEKNEKLQESSLKATFLSGIMMPISAFINNLGVVGISIVGALFVLNGKINIGNFQSFVQYSRSFTGPIVNMTEILNILQGGIAAAERVFEILDAEEEVEENTKAISTEGLKPNVVFDNVSFCYNENELVIKNVNIDIKAGSTVAIVGPTGGGKTTLVNLLMRFYDVNEGCIKIDGVDIRDIHRSDLRNYFGMVLQDTWLFEGTIRENIAYGKADATDEEVISAAKSAYAHGFISHLADGYDTILEENASNISEGQKQLITISRALISNPKIMILDEATSSIDTRTERLIQKAMEKLVEGRTSFIIAHRLSTIINADLILVVNEGNIIEQGTHKELLEKGGFYEELYTSQF